MSDLQPPTGADSLFELGLVEENPKCYYPGHSGQIWLTIIALVGLVAAIAVPRFSQIQKEKLQCGHKPSCIAQLKQIDSAKEQWAMDNKKPFGAVVQFSDLVGATLYMKSTPTCPNGGEYSVNVVGKNPTCTRKGDNLP